MLLDIKNIDVSVEGDVSISEFGIKEKNKPKLFNYLFNKIYSDKLTAIIREVSSNALDAHVAAGKRLTQIRVELPTKWDSNLQIRDYGVGLTHREMVETYTSLCESTKSNSDDQTGCFGLGSKSPFCYTDSFSIDVFQNGICRHYSAYKGNGETPQLALLFEEHTSEPDGLKVIIPIKEDEKDACVEKALKFFSFWKIPPIINYSLTKHEIVYEGDGFTIYKNWELSNHVYARMGAVMYPIAREYYSSIIGNEGNKILIDFDIGQLGVTVSREELEYDQKTINSINKRVRAVAQEIKNLYKNAISCVNSFTEKQKVFHDFHSKFHSFHSSFPKTELVSLNKKNPNLISTLCFYGDISQDNEFSKTFFSIYFSYHKYQIGKSLRFKTKYYLNDLGLTGVKCVDFVKKVIKIRSSNVETVVLNSQGDDVKDYLETYYIDKIVPQAELTLFSQIRKKYGGSSKTPDLVRANRCVKNNISEDFCNKITDLQEKLYYIPYKSSKSWIGDTINGHAYYPEFPNKLKMILGNDIKKVMMVKCKSLSKLLELMPNIAPADVLIKENLKSTPKVREFADFHDAKCDDFRLKLLKALKDFTVIDEPALLEYLSLTQEELKLITAVNYLDAYFRFRFEESKTMFLEGAMRALYDKYPLLLGAEMLFNLREQKAIEEIEKYVKSKN